MSDRYREPSPYPSPPFASRHGEGALNVLAGRMIRTCAATGRGQVQAPVRVNRRNRGGLVPRTLPRASQLGAGGGGIHGAPEEFEPDRLMRWSTGRAPLPAGFSPCPASEPVESGDTVQIGPIRRPRFALPVSLRIPGSGSRPRGRGAGGWSVGKLGRRNARFDRAWCGRRRHLHRHRAAVPRHLRREVPSRVDPRTGEDSPLDERAVREAVQRLPATGRMRKTCRLPVCGPWPVGSRIRLECRTDWNSRPSRGGGRRVCASAVSAPSTAGFRPT